MSRAALPLGVDLAGPDKLAIARVLGRVDPKQAHDYSPCRNLHLRLAWERDVEQRVERVCLVSTRVLLSPSNCLAHVHNAGQLIPRSTSALPGVRLLPEADTVGGYFDLEVEVGASGPVYFHRHTVVVVKTPRRE